MRSLVRTILGLIRTTTTYKIHSILAKYEYQSPTYKISKKAIKWLKEIELTDTDRMAMDAYPGIIQTTQKQIDIFESHIASISKEDQRTRLLMTIAGINYITALTVISEIAARRGPQKAKVAAAKEMLVISWHMLTKMEPYRTQNHSLIQREWNQNLIRPDTVQNTHLGDRKRFRITSTRLINTHRKKNYGMLFYLVSSML
ncbi:MAG: hypothetical protein QXX85_08690 [Candidatus Nitrosotenuis sp.]